MTPTSARRIERTLSALLLFLLPIQAAPLRGRVTSQSLPVPGASVTVSQNGRSLVAWSRADGTYFFPDLPAGPWRVEVAAFGFSSASGTVTAAAAALSADWTLEIPKSAAVAPAANAARRGAYERVQMNQLSSSETVSPIETEVALPSTAAAFSNASSNETFLVSGSLSRGLQFQEMGLMPPGGFPGGPPGGMPGEFGPGTGELGMPGAPGSELGAAAGPPGAGGQLATGQSGRGGGPGGGRMMGGGPGGGPRMGGGPGGGGPPMGGMRGGGPGGPRGGPGGPGGRPEWLGGRDVAAFGNRRPNQQNQYRGRVNLSLNNSAFDARPYALNGQQSAQTEYSRYRYGLSIGGPLGIPKLFKVPGANIFFNYSGTRSDNPINRYGIVPTAAQLRGDFSTSAVRGQAVTIYDPRARLPFSGALIPATRIDSAARGLTSFFPLPTLAGAVQNYQLQTSTASDNDDLSVRLDQTLGRKHRLSASFSYQSRSSESVQLFGFRDPSDGRGLRVNLGWSHTLSATMVNNLRADFSRNRSDLIPYFANGADVAAGLGIAGTSRNPLNYGPPNLSFTNFAALSDASPSRNATQSLALNEGLTIVRGSHNLNAGFMFRRSLTNQISEPSGRGAYAFSGLLTSAFDAKGNPVTGTGYDFADFLLGFPQTSTIRYGNAAVYFRGSSYAVHFGDDWRITSRFSINAGVRYEYTQPVYEKYGRAANLDIGPGFSAVSLVTPAQTGTFTGAFPAALVDADPNNFAPRIGLAWRPSGKRSWVVRSGYGIYYNGNIYNQIASRLAQQPPFAVTTSQTTVVSSPLTIRTGFVSRPASTSISNTYAVDRGYRTGYGQTWNLAFQTSLPGAFMLETGYLATKGTRLDVQRLPNQAPPGSPADSENRRPIPYALGFTYDSSIGNSIFHAGQIRLNRRFRGGLNFGTFYTLGKSIDDVSSYGGGRAVVVQDNSNLRAERGLSSFDQRHSFNANIMYSTSGGRRSRRSSEGLLAHLIRDWSLMANLNAASGTPLTAMALGNRSDAGGSGVVGSARAAATGLPVSSSSGYFNLAAFTVPASGVYGNAGRNTIPGPATFGMGGSVTRSIPILGERRALEIAASAENLLNHVNITGFGATVNSADYGLATSAGSMRRISLELRFRF